jgi:DNA-binding NtrC family response regulator
MKKIIVLDDDLVLLELFYEFLLELEIEAIKFNDPTEMLPFFLENQHLPVITDFCMPKMNGDQVIIELRKINPNVKILLTSGYFQLKDFTNVDILPKPFQFDQFRKKVAKLFI